MNIKCVFFLLIITVAGCSNERIDIVDNADAAKLKVLVNENYGFSFSYPSDWQEVTKDLPERWAILKDGSTMLFTVNEIEVATAPPIIPYLGIRYKFRITFSKAIMMLIKRVILVFFIISR